MYLSSLKLEHYGPIEYLNLDFPFNENGNPKPVVFVGQNGSGKSIVLSHLVNSMLSAKGVAFNDHEVEKGMVYKLRSPGYIHHGKTYYRSYVHFEDGLFQAEIQTHLPKKQFEEQYAYTPADINWERISPTASSVILGNFHEREEDVRKKLSVSSMLYFPANRFEEPAWLNLENLRNVTTYASWKRMQGDSNRSIINYAPLRTNQSWLLDVIYDSFAIERTVELVQLGPAASFPAMKQIDGPATKLRTSVEGFISALLKGDGPLTWAVGGRGRRSISISSNKKPLASNLFGLSTGQTGLLNIFLTLIRDFDTSDSAFTSLEDVKGLVVIDEVDLHLHTEHQHNILPELISLFPKVQFVLTSHSPLFILGMQRRLGPGGFTLVELPTGNNISVERFSEFEAAYEHFRMSTRFENDVRKSVVESQTPVLFTEGSIDIDYLVRAADLLGRQQSIANFRLLDANGFGGLDKIWRHFDSNIAELSNRRVTLLYDCDVSKPNSSKAGVARITIPTQANKIAKGIENLFPDGLVQRAMLHNSGFIDVTPAFQRTVRSQVVDQPEKWEVNVDEKRNLADWILQNGISADFSAFEVVFDLLDEAAQQIAALHVK